MIYLDVGKTKLFLVITIIIYLIIYTIFLIFGLILRDQITITLTYFLVIATFYYAWTNSKILRLMESDRLFEIKPQFAFRLFKNLTEVTITNFSRIKKIVGKSKYQKKEEINNIYLFIRNIGRGSASTIKLEVFLIGRKDNNSKFFYGKIPLNPIIRNEEIWVDITLPVSIDNITLENKYQKLNKEENIDFYVEIYLTFYDTSHNFDYNYDTRNLELMESLNKGLWEKICYTALENNCKLKEIDSNKFEVRHDILEESLERRKTNQLVSKHILRKKLKDKSKLKK